MCAEPAFADPDQSRIFVKILNSDRFLKFPPFFPNGARKFILGLLEPKPYLRLGFVRRRACRVASRCTRPCGNKCVLHSSTEGGVGTALRFLRVGSERIVGG